MTRSIRYELRSRIAEPNSREELIKLKKMLSNLVSSFVMGLFIYYALTQTITWVSVLACLAAVGVVALGYLAAYAFKRNRKKVLKS